MPPLRRGMSARRGRGGASMRTEHDRAVSEVIRAEREKAAAVPPREVCGMCGSCSPAEPMPPWAPERLARAPLEERKMIMLQFRASEETGRVRAEIRAEALAAGAKAHTNIGPRIRRTPTRISTVLSGDIGGRASRRSSRIAKLDAGGRSASPPRRGVSPTRRGVSPARREPSPARRAPFERNELDEFGADEYFDDGQGVGQAGGSSTTDVQRGDGEESCDDCDELETKVRDLEMQLDVLHKVVKSSSGSVGGGRRESDADSQQSDDSSSALQRSKTWRDRVSGYLAGSPAGERQRLKDEVAMLRDATTFLFKKMQDHEPRRS